MYDGLETEVGLLHHKAIETLTEVGLVVVYKAADGDHQLTGTEISEESLFWRETSRDKGDTTDIM